MSPTVIRVRGYRFFFPGNHGVWLLAEGRELFLCYDDFPWFKDAPIGKIINVEHAGPGHFRWPDLDVDVGIESIAHPEKYPLKAK